MSIKTVADVGSNATYGGAGIGVIGLINEIDFVAITGLVIALGGFVINWHYRRKDDKRKQDDERRKQELHELKVEKIKNGEWSIDDE